MKKSKAAGPLKDLYRQSVCQANQLAMDIYSSANTQVSQEMRQLLEAGDYSAIVSASIDPMLYGSTNVDTFSRDYLCVELMSKFPSWDIGVDRAQVALKKFSEVEESLAQLTLRGNPQVVVGLKSATMHAVLETARNKIVKILGDVDLNEVYSFFAFGPGASTSLSRRRSDAAYKFGATTPQLTYNAVPLADALLKMHPTWRFTAEVVGGSRLVTVPKNAKTDRSICIEPDLNMYFQKGLGKTIRRRLQRWGLLKRDAQQYNAELAREGSAYGRLATVDLSSASDSIHMGLVGQLLPPTWVDLIELMRSPQVVLPNGEKHLLRKVSSMGNGFTFELETLVFYALCRAVIDLLASREMDHRCTVFGDDIIIDAGLVPALREVLSFCGFTMNPKKTFSEGLFRESCGKHYFYGTDVTPFYIREPIDTVLRKYWAANTVKRFSRLPWGLSSDYKVAYDNIVDSIPKRFQGFKIPEGVGDGGLVSDWDEVRPNREADGHDAWVYRSIVAKAKMDEYDSHGTLLKSLHQLEFPREEPDVAHDAMSRIIAVMGAKVKRDSLVPFVINEEQYSNDLEGLEQYYDHVMELEDRYASDIPVQRGHRIKRGTVRQWPSFGPWLV